MSTIALVLHDPAAQKVRELWSLVETRSGLKGTHKVPFPHVTLLGFDGVSHPQVKEILERVSQVTGPFELSTQGIGIFREPAPIIYAPVVRTPSLDDLHRRLHHQVAALGGTLSELYQPDRWVPHITLAQGPASPASYGELVEHLLKEELEIRFDARNLTLFQWVGPRYEPCDRFPLMGVRNASS